jgi:hypothetical protein
MMKLFFVCICLVLLGCTDNSNKNQSMDSYVDKEIRDRVKTINDLNKGRDTLIIDPVAVRKKVDELILVSKDIENLSASVTMGNAYFAEMTKRYHLNSSDIKQLNTGMHVNDIASALKQNEMVLFNHVLLQVNKDAVPLHSAQ